MEGVQRKSLLSPQLFPDQEQTWSCPKCRGEYLQSQCPQKYQCYCGKMEDPPVDPWLLPHSCGDSCDKPLLPECGHHCLSLCHPGKHSLIFKFIVPPTYLHVSYFIFIRSLSSLSKECFSQVSLWAEPTNNEEVWLKGMVLRAYLSQTFGMWPAHL